MKDLFNKIVSVLMAFVVMFSTMSFTIDMHYCGDTLVDTAIFQKAKTCGMEESSTDTDSECSTMKKNCCSNEQFLVEGQDEINVPNIELSYEQQLFIASFVFTYINLFEGLEEKVSLFEQYKPPLVIKEIYKIDETYLI